MTAASCSPGLTSSTSGKFAGSAVLLVVAVGDLPTAMLQAAVAETSTLRVCVSKAVQAAEVAVIVSVCGVEETADADLRAHMILRLRIAQIRSADASW